MTGTLCILPLTILNILIHNVESHGRLTTSIAVIQQSVPQKFEFHFLPGTTAIYGYHTI